LEFLDGNAAFHLEADIDQRQVFLDGYDDPFDHHAFLEAVGGESLVQ